MALRCVLSILTVYRVIGCRPVLKIETITDSFQGLSTTLPFEELHRVIALFPGSLILKPATPHLMSEAAGPNYPRATWSSGLDALAFLPNPLIWVSWIVIAIATRSWMLLSWQLGVVILSAPVIPLLALLGSFPIKLGRLAKLFEGAGKVRVIAITDWWTQCLLLPLHSAIFALLKGIDQDGTHDQIRPLKLLSEIARGRPSYSFDLSAATDRLPIDLQVQVLKLFGVRWANAWAVLLTWRGWHLGSKVIKYTVGQPMGAYSSWAMLALTHHVIVQLAAYRAGHREWFVFYALLGDDIVIRDTLVANNYRSLMATLGVPINMSKSLVSMKGCIEFAKRWLDPDANGEFSPIGAGLILVTIRNLRFIPMVIAELVAKDFGFMPMRLIDLISLTSILRRKTPRDLTRLVSMLALGPTGGLWGSGQLPNKFGAWIASFHQNASPDVVSQHAYYALCGKAIVDARRAEESLIAARETLARDWLKYPVLGTSLAMAVLSAPLMIISPGLWSTLRSINQKVITAPKWFVSNDPRVPDGFDWHGQDVRVHAMWDVARTYLGSLSVLNWTDRKAVLDYFAGQEFLLKELRYTIGQGLYGGRSLVVYKPTLFLETSKALVPFDESGFERGMETMNRSSLSVLIALIRQMSLSALIRALVRARSVKTAVRRRKHVSKRARA